MRVASGEALEVFEVARPGELEALRGEWSELFAADPAASPFQSPEWLLAWRGAFLAEGLWTLAIRERGRLVGLLPMFIHRRQLTLLGNGISDRLDLLAPLGRAEAVAQAVGDHLSRRADRWDSLDFRDLPAGSALLTAPIAGVQSIEAEAPCPTVRLPDDPGAVLDLLAPRRAQDFRRRARRLAEAGRATFRTSDRVRLDHDMSELQKLHALRWRARGEAGVLDDPAVQAFHRAAAPALLANGLLRLDLLDVDGRVIAAHYGLAHGGRGYSYLHAFDPAFASLGPSSLLLGHVLQRLVREGAREFDFLRGREAYKYDWGAMDRPQFRRRLTR